MAAGQAVRGRMSDEDAFFGSVSMAHRFAVAIDRSRYELGHWSSASGLNVSWQTAEYRAGDSWNHPLVFPGVPQYQRIKLSRAACRDSQIVQEWLTETAMRNEPLTGAISLVNWQNDRTVTWELKEFFPAAWGINEFNSSQGNVALETLEIVHTGFLDDDFAPGSPGS
ncbi:T4-like virus tail tube protein gp19 [Streptomyces sp. ADI96-02]|uniref:phage tail protein n=1 Tax=unclassified Streptomyces TaxID=2593676 RepID=UPI000F55915C|nr:phage tail protein [Streptomyces sp. ADI96-02]RPK67546.1 T4-like virus tail tube protein gp19 [Streptomyces sp. ADI96-02]